MIQIDCKLVTVAACYYQKNNANYHVPYLKFQLLALLFTRPQKFQFHLLESICRVQIKCDLNHMIGFYFMEVRIIVGKGYKMLVIIIFLVFPQNH